MSTESLLVIIPALNEQATIADVVTAVLNLGFDTLVVDDGSTDSTAQLARNAGAIVLSLPINLGVGGALRAGFRYAIDHGYSSVVQVDADGQHPLHQIRSLQEAALRKNAHLVIGSRYLSSETTLSVSKPRRFAMRCMSRIASGSAGRTITDTTSGFRIIREPLLSEFAREFPSYYLGDTFEATVAAIRAGYYVCEEPAALTPRRHGRSTAGAARAVMLIAKVLLVAIARLHPQLRPFRDGSVTTEHYDKGRAPRSS